MTPEERDLIASVFQRLEQVAGAPKDADANALIGDYMRRQPEAAYGLVQAVLVQESALKQAQTRIADLEQRLARSGGANAGTGAGGFLPQSGGNPWVQSAPQPAPAQPVYQPQPAYQQAPAYQQQPMAQSSPWGQPAAGGFLRNAATAAVGVAGGMLVAEGISSLFSGHHSGFGGGFGNTGYGGPQETVENVTVNNYYGDQQGNTQAAGYDSSYDTGGDASWSGDDSSDGGDSWM
jgi:hypothetical protein